MGVEYPDSNGNGVPDVFENRLPISEVLNLPDAVIPPKFESVTTLTVEMEIGQRPARRGELYFLSGAIQRSSYDSSVCVTIVRRIISAPADWWPITR